MNEFFRTSLGLNFLTRTIKEDRTFEMYYENFKPTKINYNFRLHLEAISLLISGSNLLEMDTYKDIADDLFDDFVLKKTFYNENKAFVICDEESSVIHNAMAAIISKKLNNDMYDSYINSVLECIEEDRILGLYSINDGPNHVLKSHLGTVLIALLLNDDLLDRSIVVGNHLLDKPYFDPTMVWGLKILTHKTGNKQYTEAAQKVYEEISEISISSMNALVLGLAQQINIAMNNWNYKIYKQQSLLQITKLENFNGAFIHKPKLLNVRIDENLMNLWSFIQKQKADISLDKMIEYVI